MEIAFCGIWINTKKWTKREATKLLGKYISVDSSQRTLKEYI